MSGMVEEYRSCHLCPCSCGVDRASGILGMCSCDGTPRVARAALHHWEEPPISGSRGSGTIFISGCSLSCAYCQNQRISRSQAGEPCSVADLARKCLDLQDQGAMNVNFVTPTHFAPHVRGAIEVARDLGLSIPIVWNTSGYELPEQIDANHGLVDVYLADMKYYDDELAHRLSGIRDYRDVVVAALDAMVATAGRPAFEAIGDEERMASGVIVRHMLLPGHVDDSKRIVGMVHSRYGDDVRLSLMSQYTPVSSSAAEADPSLGRVVTLDEYEELLDHADRIGVQDYYWQDGEACLESFIPDFEP